jgi:hypothetical protein
MLNVNENEIVNKNELSDADLEMVAGSGRYPVASCGCSTSRTGGGIYGTVAVSPLASLASVAVIVGP